MKTPCRDCDGTGLRDTGGVHPWGEPIFLPCDCEHDVAVEPPEDEDDDYADENRHGWEQV